MFLFNLHHINSYEIATSWNSYVSSTNSQHWQGSFFLFFFGSLFGNNHYFCSCIWYLVPLVVQKWPVTFKSRSVHPTTLLLVLLERLGTICFHFYEKEQCECSAKCLFFFFMKEIKTLIRKNIIVLVNNPINNIGLWFYISHLLKSALLIHYVKSLWLSSVFMHKRILNVKKSANAGILIICPEVADTV